MAAFLADHATAADWSKWSDVGQTFGALSSIISGLALAAIVVAARAQHHEMQENRRELEGQRRSLADHQVALSRTAAANLGMLHLEILKMSVVDPELAEVWPALEPSLSPELNRKYLYANIIYQFQFRAMQDGSYSEEQILANLRYLFTSPLMRAYWRSAQFARTSLPASSEEFAFAQRVDEVCREFEAVVASANMTERRDDMERFHGIAQEPPAA